VPTPVPLSYANVRLWQANGSAESQYSVPVRLTDNGVVYDNQDTLDWLQSTHRCHHVDVGVTSVTQVPVTSGVGDGRIMRFVELRQVRAADDREHPGDVGRRRDFRSYSTEDRYLVAPTVAERTAPSRRLCCRRPDKPDAVYVNVENAPACRTSANEQLLPDTPLEEDTEHCRRPAECEATTGQGEHANETCKENVELSHGEEQLDDDSGFSCSVTSPDFCENAAQKTKNDDRNQTGSVAQLNKETGSESSRSPSQHRLLPDTAPTRPSPQIRLADAYLLRMSPPPPSNQLDGRRRAAYSDPVRWVSPVSASSADQHHRQADIAPLTPNMTKTRHGTSGRPNGFRSPAGNESGGGVPRTAAMTCTNEALNEAIQRRNRKCKPSAIRRLQAAKAVGCGVPETAATLSSFQPIFEGVTCSLRTRSASLTDCNALAKAHGHALHF